MRRPGAIALLISLILAGCGGSSRSSSSATTAGSSTPTAATTSSAPATSAATTSAATTSATSAGTTGAASSSTSTTTAAPDTNVRLPAKFAIRPGGALSPPVVAAPKHTTIDLTVRSQDGKQHTLVLATPHAHTLTVAPGRPAQVALNGLRNGVYVVTVDGAIRGRLIVGAAPGP